MQPDEVAVTPESMALHAATVKAVADEVETAHAAATQIRLDHGAYGQLCAFVPGFLNGLSDGLMTGLHGAVASLRNTSDDLTAVAQSLVASDAKAHDYVNGIVE
jgi:hypothetical protein